VPVAIVACLEGLAAVAALRGDASRAARLFAAVATLRATAAFAPLLPLVRELFDTLLEQTRQRLGDAAWAAAWESGEAIIYGQADATG
jgi:hypothetical protein